MSKVKNTSVRSFFCHISAPWISILALGTVLVSCSPEPEVPVSKTPRPVKAFEISNGGAEKILEFPGQIEAHQKSYKAFEVAGKIDELLVKEGQEIEKGQVLARLDPRDYDSALNSALAHHKAVKVVAERLEILVKNDSVSKQQVELAQRDLAIADAALRLAEKARADTELKADFDGKVAMLLVEEFENVVAKENVMMIQDDSELQIVIQVPERVFAIPIEGETDEEKVARTMPEVFLSAMPGRGLPARLFESSEVPDPVTRTYKITLTFDPPADGLIQAGMTAKVRAKIPPNERSRTQGYPVPMNSVVADQSDGAYVWRIDPDDRTVSKVPVEAGAMVDDEVVVTGGLEGGDIIAVSGVHHLEEGQLVRLWEKE